MALGERRLVRRLQERDEGAFTELVRRYKDTVFNLVYRMLGNREEAEDLSQEVFVTIFKSIDSFRGESKLSTWIYRIAVNQCKNRYKYLARRQLPSTRALDEAAEHSAAGRDGGPVVSLQAQISRPDHLVQGMQLEQAIQREIAALDEDHRLLIVLRDIQGLSYEEMSRITGLQEGTVKSRLHRARAALKDRMMRYL